MATDTSFGVAAGRNQSQSEGIEESLLAYGKVQNEAFDKVNEEYIHKTTRIVPDNVSDPHGGMGF